MLYFSIGEIQNRINYLFKKSGETQEFLDVLYSLYLSNSYLDNVKLFNNDINKYIGVDLEDIFKYEKGQTKEYYFINEVKDVTCIHHFHNLNLNTHKHSCFEILYVYEGSCTLIFEDTNIELSNGDLCILSPGSMHEIYTKDESSFIVPIMVNEKTFHLTFTSLLNSNDILGNFFRDILTNNAKPNYLVFKTGYSEDIKLISKRLYNEPYRYDSYTNICCIEWLKLLFSYVLRFYTSFDQYYSYSTSYNFSDLILYVQKNYRTVSLNDLASKFNYSRPYLSLIIKQITGMSYSDLIKRMKMEEAKNYIEHSNKSIDEIAFLVGYNSSDHFSRTFRSYYGVSPQKYKKL